MNPLLLECCRPRLDAAEIRRLAAASPDWTALAAAAVRHKLAPLFFWGLKRACADLVPPEILAGLRGHFDGHTRNNLLFSADLHRVLELLRAGGIQAIPFKGPTLAWSIYPAPGLRPMSDLDLIVPESEVDRSLAILIAHGYRSKYPDRLLRGNGEITLVRTRAATIDLHRRLAPAHFGGLDFEAFRRRLTYTEIAGRRTPTFCPEDLLLYLCVHGGNHFWGSALWICDVATLTHASPLNWDDILARADQNHLSRMLLLGLHLADTLFGAAVPLEVRKRWEVSRIADLAATVNKLLDGERVSVLALPRFKYGLLETRRDRLCLFRSHFRPQPTDGASLHIPEYLFPLYFVLRPLRLAWMWAGRFAMPRSRPVPRERTELK